MKPKLTQPLLATTPLAVCPKLLRKQIAALEKANPKAADDLLMGLENFCSELLHCLRSDGTATIVRRTAK